MNHLGHQIGKGLRYLYGWMDEDQHQLLRELAAEDAALTEWLETIAWRLQSLTWDFDWIGTILGYRAGEIAFDLDERDILLALDFQGEDADEYPEYWFRGGAEYEDEAFAE